MTNPTPARVAGPGAMSQRTDAGGQPIRSLPDPKYGEAQEFAQLQKAAPLAAGPKGPQAPYPSDVARQMGRQPAPQAGPQGEPQRLPGLFDPGDPSVPVTSGAPIGAGPNSVQGPGIPPRAMRTSEQLAQYAGGDGGEIIASLVNMLNEMGQ